MRFVYLCFYLICAVVLVGGGFGWNYGIWGWYKTGFQCFRVVFCGFLFADFGGFYCCFDVALFVGFSFKCFGVDLFSVNLVLLCFVFCCGFDSLCFVGC